MQIRIIKAFPELFSPASILRNTKFQKQCDEMSMRHRPRILPLNTHFFISTLGGNPQRIPRWQPRRREQLGKRPHGIQMAQITANHHIFAVSKEQGVGAPTKEMQTQPELQAYGSIMKARYFQQVAVASSPSATCM